jgi:putative peptidoglycan lipid II flippase
MTKVIEMIRLILPAIFFLGMSGVVTGLLYSLKRFTFPAFTTAAFNLGIVVVALALTPTLGINSLVLGVVIGSAIQIALQLPGLRGMDFLVAELFSSRPGAHREIACRAGGFVNQCHWSGYRSQPGFPC